MSPTDPDPALEAARDVYCLMIGVRLEDFAGRETLQEREELTVIAHALTAYRRDALLEAAGEGTDGVLVSADVCVEASEQAIGEMVKMSSPGPWVDADDLRAMAGGEPGERA